MEKSSLYVHCLTIHDIISIPEGGLFVELEALALPSGREAVVGRPEHRRLETGAQLLGNVLSSGTTYFPKNDLGNIHPPALLVSRPRFPAFAASALAAPPRRTS